MFDSIKNMIQKMIFHLMDEQKNEDEHKHWCDKELTNTELMLTEKADKKSDAEATITQLAEKIQDLKNGITSNQDAVAEAIAVLTTFYKNSGEVQKEAWESFAQTS